MSVDETKIIAPTTNAALDRCTGAFGLYPVEYKQHVIAFFDAALLDEMAPQ